MPNYHITRDDVKKYKGNPNGAIMPDYVGQLCIDELKEVFYISTSLNINGWVTSTFDGEIDISSKQDKTDNNLNTTNKTITGAINELKTKVDETFQNANNGKQLIANAIGEPLNADDTFSAMSTDIDNLVSSFKSSLINAGVAVNNNDKFKQLIDKIKNISEEDRGSVKFSEGSVSINDLTCERCGNLNSQINIDFGFTPSFVMLGPFYTKSTESIVTIVKHIYINSVGKSSLLENSAYAIIESVTNKGFTITIQNETVPQDSYAFILDNNANVKYYAIGVGEEDTAFLDSLKSILNDEGVATTDSDTMGDLIVKVDEEFARKNAQGIKINCVSTLPTTPVENQIVVITPNVPSVKEIKDYNDCIPTSNGQVIIGASTTNNSGSMVPYSITTNGVVLNLYLAIAKGKFHNALETYNGYIGRNGSWVQFSVKGNVLYDNGYDAIGFTSTNNWSYSSTRIYFSNTSTSIDLKMKAYNGGWNDEYAYFKNPIDLTNVKQVRIVGSYYNNGAEHSGVGFVASNNFTVGPTWARKVNLTKSVEEVITDVSSLKGSYYFGTVNRCDSTARNAMRITEFELIY